MIQKEFRLVCRGIQLISVLELDETTKNITVAQIRKEELNKQTNSACKNEGILGNGLENETKTDEFNRFEPQ